MLYFNRTDISEGIDVNKCDKSVIFVNTSIS